MILDAGTDLKRTLLEVCVGVALGRNGMVHNLVW